MNGSDGARPRLSRETRRLLTAGALALAALWVLALIRFPDRAATPNPVSPVLNQIVAPPGFPDLAAEVERAQRRIDPQLAHIRSVDPAGAGGVWALPAWPLADGLAVTILPPQEIPANSAVVARDSTTGLVLLKTTASPAAERSVWKPDGLNRPRYVFAVAPAPRQPSVTPVYISSLQSEQSAPWSGFVWTAPAAIGLQAGSLLFTAAGEWVGGVADERTRLVVVPAEHMLRAAEELQHRSNATATLGLRVQSLTPAISDSTRATSGVIVTWVDSRGPSADEIALGDVIDAVNGEAVATIFTWSALTRRLVPDATVRLRRQRAGVTAEVSVTAAAADATPHDFGLTLAPSGDRSRVVQVAAGSAADRAGIRSGDVLAAVGASAALTPAELRRRFDSLPPTGTMLLAVTRGDDHHIVVLAR